MDPKRLQVTIGRMLSATACVALDLAIVGALKTYKGPPVPALIPTVLLLGVFGMSCAIPGALIGKALKWCGTGLLIGLATGGAMALLKLFLVHVIQTVWLVPPWVYLLFCLSAATAFVLGAMKCVRMLLIRRAIVVQRPPS